MADQLGILLAGFTNLLGLQLASRLLTFFFNLLIVRRLSPEEYGVAAVQFHLLTTTILFLSREGFRRGCLRKDGSQEHEDKQPNAESLELQRVLGICWLPIPVGIVISTIVCSFLCWSQTGDDSSAYCHAVVLNGVATVIELCSEPMYIIAHLWLRFDLRLAVEGTATLVKMISVLLLLDFTLVNRATIFAYSQVAFAVVSLIGYGTLAPRIFKEAGDSLTLKTMLTFDPGMMSLSLIFSFQAVVKHFLAEGSKFVLVSVESWYHQGVYGLVNNLGSLVVRLLFQPLEESAFTAFSRSGVSRSDKQGMGRLVKLLAALVRGVSLIGTMAITFGPSYSKLFLRIVYSTKWSTTEAPTVLALYCGYIPLLAINGITEAFTHAVLDVKGLGWSNVFMIAVTLVHVAISVAFVRTWGSCGLVLADGLNMAMRIAYSFRCIGGYFRGVPSFSWTSFVPRMATLLGALAAAFVAEASRHVIFDLRLLSSFAQQACVHIAVGAACAAALVGLMYFSERQVWTDLLALKRSGEKKED
ncbi:unnamed protein product [Ostreobium quekettii]|uniref:Protein RFT1 homolog n=1 Tax=Ostreobium quekettii TaxID=121088 RepID=A0A8S1JCI7_9CHLO|nr:unnamed protein product [Ostreobium quekettii]|eukprot:evm.model.scf_368.5 EVM.evm.TU.scf_368.5   scf_368:37430-45313(-)